MNVVIRPYITENVEALYQLLVLSKAHLQPWVDWLFDDYSIEDTKQWIDICLSDWENRRAYRYVIVDSDYEEIIGAVGLEAVIASRETAELGYWVGLPFLNKGVAARAAKLALQEAFNKHNLKRIEIYIQLDNEASIKVVEKIGAVHETVCRKKLPLNGKMVSAHCYSVTPEGLIF